MPFWGNVYGLITILGDCPSAVARRLQPMGEANGNDDWEIV